MGFRKSAVPPWSSREEGKPGGGEGGEEGKETGGRDGVERGQETEGGGGGGVQKYRRRDAGGRREVGKGGGEVRRRNVRLLEGGGLTCPSSQPRLPRRADAGAPQASLELPPGLIRDRRSRGGEGGGGFTLGVRKPGRRRGHRRATEEDEEEKEECMRGGLAWGVMKGLEGSYSTGAGTPLLRPLTLGDVQTVGPPRGEGEGGNGLNAESGELSAAFS